MKRYCIKSPAGKTEFIDIVKEMEDGYVVRITRLLDGYEKNSETVMTRHLFNICLTTGYIFEHGVASAAAAVA